MFNSNAGSPPPSQEPDKSNTWGVKFPAPPCFLSSSVFVYLLPTCYFNNM